MKIRHTIIEYAAPLFLALICFVGGIGDKSDAGVAMLVVALVIVAGCGLNWFTTSLEIKNGLITGCTGIIKKQRLSSSISKIQYCEYKHFLCFNTIRINAITGQYTFKNMGNASKFVDMVNKESA